eukprot:15025428-Alexandrium_andersonii.AAC.1
MSASLVGSEMCIRDRLVDHLSRIGWSLPTPFSWTSEEGVRIDVLGQSPARTREEAKRAAQRK